MSFLKVRNWQVLCLLGVLVLILAVAAPGVVTANDTFHITGKHHINGNSAGAILFGDPKALPKELPVDIYINGGLAFEDFKFGQKTEADLPAGTYTIDVTLANAPLSSAIMSFGPAPIPAGVEVVATAKLINKTPTLDIKVR
jgi:hypothetical protein